MPTLNINITDGATPTIKRFITGLRRRKGLHRMMGNRVQAVTRDHLIGISRTRHATANRLGARPSGHWGKAAEKVARPSALSADENGGALTLNHPGAARGFRDIQILPTGGRTFLTIPLITQAYNRRAPRVPGLFRPGKKGAKKNVLSRVNRDGSLTHWYALVRSVFQRMDRSLFPSDAEYREASLKGVLDYLRWLRSQAGGVA